MLRKAIPRLIPVLFIGTILLLVYAGLADVVVMAEDAKGPATLTATELRDRIEELKWILGLIVIASGLFTLAQGVAAGFSAQSFTKQAEETLARLKELEDSVRKTYPLAAQFDERRAQANLSLTRKLAEYSPLNNPDEGFDSRRNFYARLPFLVRQEMLSIERSLSYDIAGQLEPVDEFARGLRRWAQFYWSKFIYEQGRGIGYLGDLERAESLLGLAARKIGDQFYLYNDLGNILLESYKARIDPRFSRPGPSSTADIDRDLERARKAFDDSIASNPRQIRAYYNLAVLEADYRGNLPRAIALLQSGVQHPNWESIPVAELQCVAYFNLGCYFGRLAKMHPDPSAPARKCVEALEMAAAIGQLGKQDVDREFEVALEREGPDSRLTGRAKEGDLYYLATSGNQIDRLRLGELRPLLSAQYKKESEVRNEERKAAARREGETMLWVRGI